LFLPACLPSFSLVPLSACASILFLNAEHVAVQAPSQAAPHCVENYEMEMYNSHSLMMMMMMAQNPQAREMKLLKVCFMN
jgi:hypothetical protein